MKINVALEFRQILLTKNNPIFEKIQFARFAVVTFRRIHPDAQIHGNNEQMKDEVLFADEAYEIVGACLEVYNTMGSGFLEPVYQECLELEFEKRSIPALPQQKISLSYKGTPLSKVYIPDFICFEKIIVEIKSVTKLTAEHQAQLFNYLKAAKLTLGLLVNFSSLVDLEFRRIALTKNRSNI